MDTQQLTALTVEPSTQPNEWSLGQRDVLLPRTSREVLVRVRHTLVDLRIAEGIREGQPALGIFVGETVEGPAAGASRRLVLGIGPLQNCLLVSPEQLVAVPSCWDGLDPASLPLVHQLSRLHEAVQQYQRAGKPRMLVVGLGLRGALTMHLLRTLGLQDVWGADDEQTRTWWPALGTRQLMILPRGDRQGNGRARPRLDVELLLDTTCDAAVWQDALRFIRPHGHVVLLVPSGMPAQDVNFYPDVHRHSLTLRAFPFGDRTGILNQDGAAYARTVLQRGPYTNLLSHVEIPQGRLDRLAMPIDRPGLLVSWPCARTGAP